MTIVPIKELKDSSKISQLCHSAQEPVYVTKNGYADLVIMSAEVFESIERSARSGETIRLVQAGIDAAKAGELRDARDSIAEIRAKYGI